MIPENLNLLSGVFLIISNIFLTLDGKMATSKPSKKKINPIAVNRSLIQEPIISFLKME